MGSGGDGNVRAAPCKGIGVFAIGALGKTPARWGAGMGEGRQAAVGGGFCGRGYGSREVQGTAHGQWEFPNQARRMEQWGFLERSGAGTARPGRRYSCGRAMDIPFIFLQNVNNLKKQDGLKGCPLFNSTFHSCK